MLNRTFAAAGAASGLCEGIVRATSKEVFGLVHGGAGHTKPAHQHPRKPLINLVIVGDDVLDAANLARAFAGEERPQGLSVGVGSTRRTGFLLLQRRLASVCLWHVGCRVEAADLGPAFYSLASAFLLVYSPSQPGPAQSLSHWAVQCRGSSQDSSRPLPPLVVVASARPCPGDAAQAAAVAEAQQWCRQHDAMHHTIDGQQDTRAARAAFASLLQRTLRQHRQAAGQCVSAPTTPRGGAAAREGTASLRDLMRQLDLPALQQSRLVSPLERQPRLVHSAR